MLNKYAIIRLAILTLAALTTLSIFAISQASLAGTLQPRGLVVFTQTAKTATLQKRNDQTDLVLTDASPTIYYYFSNTNQKGTIDYHQLDDNWKKGQYNFTKYPPTVSVSGLAGHNMQTMIVQLGAPTHLAEHRLYYPIVNPKQLSTFQNWTNVTIAMAACPCTGCDPNQTCLK